MAISRYYRFAGSPRYYPVNYDGRGHVNNRAAVTRALGNTLWEEDLSTGEKWAAFGNDEEIDEDALYDHPMADWPPQRRSGPEPLDPAMVPAWQKPMGEFQLSDNEKRLALVAVAGAAAWWFFLRKPKKGRRR